MDAKLYRIIQEFSVEARIMDIIILGEGFINDTYIVKTNAEYPDYLLQRKNKNVFRDIPGMMENIRRVTDHLKQKIKYAGGDPEREALTQVQTRHGKLYTIDEDGEYWTLCVYIKDHILFELADTPELAEAGGKGIGKFQSMLSDFDNTLVDTLPGFHNMSFRKRQWREALERNASGRRNLLGQEISWIECRLDKMLAFWTMVEQGELPGRVSHNDAKISNILFDNNKEVLCMIDLDTVGINTALNDFGDAIRSSANTGQEDDRDLSRVGINIPVFEAYTRGYLSETLYMLTDTEIDYLAFSGLYITFEQVLRFLMDYIDGDTYYRIKYPEHNLVRTRAQYKLLQSMEQNYNRMRDIVGDVENQLR